MNAKVLATVEGKEITELMVNQFMQELGPQVAMQFQSPEGKQRLVEELVNQELVYQEALENKMDEDEGFKVELERMKEGLLKQYSVGKLLEGITVEEGEAEEYYNKNKDMFVKPEMVEASHILVSEEDEAKKIIEEIEGGLDFAEAAEKYSSCPSKSQGGNLGEFGRGQMVPEFEDAAFALEIGKLSEPVKTDHGYHIIEVASKSEQGITPFEEVEEQLNTQLLGIKQQERYVAKAEELKEKYEVEINI